MTNYYNKILSLNEALFLKENNLQSKLSEIIISNMRDFNIPMNNIIFYKFNLELLNDKLFNLETLYNKNKLNLIVNQSEWDNLYNDFNFKGYDNIIKTIEEKESKYYLQSINTLNGIYDSELLHNKYNKTLSLEEALFLQQNLETFYIDCINIKNYDIIIPKKYIDKKICDIKYLYLIDGIELSVKEHSWNEQVKNIFNKKLNRQFVEELQDLLKSDFKDRVLEILPNFLDLEDNIKNITSVLEYDFIKNRTHPHSLILYVKSENLVKLKDEYNKIKETNNMVEQTTNN